MSVFALSINVSRVRHELNGEERALNRQVADCYATAFDKKFQQVYGVFILKSRSFTAILGWA
jgi:hypothetical protein